MKKYFLLALVSLICSQHTYSAEDISLNQKLEDLGLSTQGFLFTSNKVLYNGKTIIEITDETPDQDIIYSVIKHHVTRAPQWVQREGVRNKHKRMYSVAGGLAALVFGAGATKYSSKRVPAGFQTLTKWGGNVCSATVAALTTGLIDRKYSKKFNRRNETEVRLAILCHRLDRGEEEDKIKTELQVEEGIGSFADALLEKAKRLQAVEGTLFAQREQAALELLKLRANRSIT